MKPTALLLATFATVVVVAAAEHPVRVPDTNTLRRVRSWTNPPGEFSFSVLRMARVAAKVGAPVGLPLPAAPTTPSTIPYAPDFGGPQTLPLDIARESRLGGEASLIDSIDLMLAADTRSIQ